MREIKFRGKRQDGLGWVYGSYVGLWKPDDVQETVISWKGNHFHVIPETVGQYTGLLDKNYNEIFEGDVVNVGEMPALQDVVIRDIRYLRAILYEVERHVWIEVIGNIHDNPELL